MIFVSFAVIVALIGALAYQQFTFSRLLERDRQEQRVERERLYQRIQDPPSAVAAHAQREIDQPVPRLFVNFDDDEDFDHYRHSMEG